MKKYKDKEWLEEQYINKKLSTTQIGKICNIAARTALYWLNKFNIKVRSKSEALTGSKNPMFGKLVSKETRKKLSISSKGKKHTEKTKQKLSNCLSGRKKTEEHKNKLSIISKKRFTNKESHPKFGKPNKWGKHTDEAKKKISEANKGKNNSMYGKPGVLLGKTGTLHPSWIEPEKRKSTLYTQIRTSQMGIEWKVSVFKRDNYTCLLCNKKQSSKTNINVDHIKPLAVIVYENKISSLDEAVRCEELWDIDNGRTLCVDCHK